MCRLVTTMMLCDENDKIEHVGMLPISTRKEVVWSPGIKLEGTKEEIKEQMIKLVDKMFEHY